MGGTHGPPKLPEGYRLDLAGDPDAPALRRPDGSVAARFSAGGMTREAVEREALEDLLRAKPGGSGAAIKGPGVEGSEIAGLLWPSLPRKTRGQNERGTGAMPTSWNTPSTHSGA